MGTSELNTIYEMVSKTVDTAQRANNASLPEYTANTRLAPVVLIENSVRTVDGVLLTGLLQTLLSIFTADYLRAINQTVNVGEVNVMQLLDQFSTSRKIGFEHLEETTLALESIDPEAASLPDFSGDDIATEERKEGRKDSVSISPANKDLKAGITDAVNLAVGKLIEVKITSNGQTTIIPVKVTMYPKEITSSEFLAIQDMRNADRSVKGRYWQWRAGELRFWRDYVLTMDLIEKDRKALLADKTGTLLEVRNRESKGVMAMLRNRNPTPNRVAAFTIITKRTAKELEISLRGKLSKSTVREKFFRDNTMSMLVVVDVEMERFTIYQRGISDYGMYTLDDVKDNAKRANGSDINEIIKAYNSGAAATL